MQFKLASHKTTAMKTLSSKLPSRRIFALVLMLGIGSFFLRRIYEYIKYGERFEMGPEFLVSGFFIVLIALCIRSALQANPGLAFSVFAINLIVILLGLEVFIRISPHYIPLSAYPFLPDAVRSHVARLRGWHTHSTITGTGMTYYYHPHTKFAAKPWLKIDEHGFRNSISVKDGADVVFLGDSVTIAIDAERDLGELFRSQGVSALNLGMGGFGPPQYRDVYMRFVADRNLNHKHVFILLCAQNDYSDTTNYLRIATSGGDYRNYLGKPARYGRLASAGPRSWVLSTIMNVPYFFFADRDDNGNVQAPSEQTALEKETPTFASLNLPYGEFSIDVRSFGFPDFGPGDRRWDTLRKTLHELFEAIADNGARATLVYMPNNAQIYGPLSEGEPAAKTQLAEKMKSYVGLLEKEFASTNVRVVDMSPALTEAAKQKMVTVNVGDFHLSTAGVEVVFEELAKFGE